jgi:hypothetical protein
VASLSPPYPHTETLSHRRQGLYLYLHGSLSLSLYVSLCSAPTHGNASISNGGWLHFVWVCRLLRHRSYSLKCPGLWVGRPCAALLPEELNNSRLTIHYIAPGRARTHSDSHSTRRNTKPRHRGCEKLPLSATSARAAAPIVAKDAAWTDVVRAGEGVLKEKEREGATPTLPIGRDAGVDTKTWTLMLDASGGPGRVRLRV